MDPEIVPPAESSIPLEPEVEETPEPEGPSEEETHTALLTLIDSLEKPEQGAREVYLRLLKKLDNYWRSRQYLIWDDEAKDYRTPGEAQETFLDLNIEGDVADYAKVANIYRAYGEAVIAALGSTIPRLTFFPADADLHQDQLAARGYSKVADLIQDRNSAQLLLLKALFILWNQGPLFAYNECVEDAKFGVIRKDVYGEVPVKGTRTVCPDCGSEMSPSPDGMTPVECDVCGLSEIPVEEEFETVEQQVVDEEEIPKTSENLQVFGPLNVKVPLWLTDFAQTPYLTLETEEHESFITALYHDPENEEETPSAQGGDDTSERETRTNIAYGGDIPKNIKSVKRSWVRPWAFFGLPKEQREILLSQFPDGVYFVRVDSKVKEALPDKLDDHWTVLRNPLSTHVQFDPLGQIAVHVQDITNEMLNLTLELIEHGLPETFYDPEVLDAEAYNKQEARPGQKYPIRPKEGKSIEQAFYTIKGGTISQEIENFARRIEQLGQLLTGAFPSIFGGVLTGGGGTKGEYEQSKAMALQRLSTTWTSLKFWWAEVMEKSTKSFVRNMRSDEKYVQKMGDSFVNVFIRQQELTGEVGQVRPELGEGFPTSWGQQRDVLFELIKLNNDAVLEIIGHSENMALVKTLIGLPELYIPGDDDRNKQLAEIAKLVVQQPLSERESSIPVDPELDHHIIEAETCKAWLKSPAGMDAQENLPAAHMNVRLHLQAHLDIIAQQEAEQAKAEAEGQEEGDEFDGPEE